MSFAPLPTILTRTLADLDPAAAAVVELGCGEGRLLRALAPCGVPVVGLDRAPPGTGAAAAVVGDATRPPLKPASWDLVLAANLVRHLVPSRPRLDFLAVWTGLLRPGGRLIILEDEPCPRPKGAVAYRRLQEFLSRVMPAGRGPLLGLGAFRDLLARSGTGGEWTFGGGTNRYPLDADAVVAMLRGGDPEPGGEADRLAERIARDGLDPGRYWWAAALAPAGKDAS
jgi:SAM-dependent methyltransferase